MVGNFKSKREEGFTIIEVLIVLAIAGLIMLIVFLAVPALQRNSRNTQRKSDITALLGSITEYVNNNNGSLPTGTAVAFSTPFSSALPNLSYYTTANVLWTNQNSAKAPTDPADLDKVIIFNYAKCTGTAASITGATSRSIAAVYDVEGSGGAKVAQCQES